MSDKQETIADIVAEMRSYADTPPPHRAWLDLADRLEKASAQMEYEAWLVGAEKIINANRRDFEDLCVHHTYKTFASNRANKTCDTCPYTYTCRAIAKYKAKKKERAMSATHG